ncbi:hypothetical protein ARMSODRAFT_973590 [Armillaria solidipes]|uniref:Uncharacterized protein n=1 Tax=Armillaria solidipes TaxID=1076256 RepID=A0A2H3BN74_9AGAR|nr:hypothetical protein ARMSODRAFT_973590 [Armillaria solidipes]
MVAVAAQEGHVFGIDHDRDLLGAPTRFTLCSPTLGQFSARPQVRQVRRAYSYVFGVQRGLYVLVQIDKSAICWLANACKDQLEQLLPGDIRLVVNAAATRLALTTAVYVYISKLALLVFRTWLGNV